MKLYIDEKSGEIMYMLKTELYVPQRLVQVNAITVMSDSRYATLAQDLQLAIENPEAARRYLQNRGSVNWTRTAVYSGKDGKLRWVEGGDGFRILDRFNYEGASGEGHLLFPSGWAILDDQTGVVWNTDPKSNEYNGGFATKTTNNEKEAEESLVKLWRDGKIFKGFSEAEARKMVLYQYSRTDSGYGLMPVSFDSIDLGGPMEVSANWYLDTFGSGLRKISSDRI